MQYKHGTDDGTLSISKANCFGNEINHPIAVGSYPHNPFGLYDMTGTVAEWCHDLYGTYPSGTVNNPSGAQTGWIRVLRGGSWGQTFTSAERDHAGAGYRQGFIGFRIVRRASP